MKEMMILHCPFCGELPEYGRSKLNGLFVIRCVTLGCVRPEVRETYRKRKQAQYTWNKRP